MKLLLTFALLLSGFSAIAAASPRASIVEENPYYIGTDVKVNGGITQEQFNWVIDRALAIYTPIFKANGMNFAIERKWEDGTVNAYAQQMGKTAMVTMFGGLARHETITADGFALVVCHEIGHHIGGYPKKAPGVWATIEGQSDIYGAGKCLRRFFAYQDNVSMMSFAPVDPYVTSLCSQAFKAPQEIATCERIALAGGSLANLFASLRQLPAAPRFDTPDRKIVTTMYTSHPEPQCRLDTYFQGALCAKSPLEPVSDIDYKQGYCTAVQGFKLGLRPRCWFKAPAEEDAAAYRNYYAQFENR